MNPPYLYHNNAHLCNLHTISNVTKLVKEEADIFIGSIHNK